MVDYEVVKIRRISIFFDSIKVPTCKIGVYAIDESRLIIKDEVGIVTYSFWEWPDPFK